MDDQEAAAVLFAIGNPLDWQNSADNERLAYRIYNCSVTEAKRYDFSLIRLPDDEIYFDRDGTPLTWWLRIYLVEGDVTERTYRSWAFPLPAPEGGKALCERLVLTDDFTEVHEGQTRWYTLKWEMLHPPMRDFPEGMKEMKGLVGGICAPVVRHGGVSWYAAVQKKRWFMRHFTAHYIVNLPEENRSEPLEAYLQRQKLRAPGVSPCRYRTREEARGACEHHHATGAWDAEPMAKGAQ